MSRIEHDFLGDLEIPDNVYYGVQSLRGKENFHITEHSMREDKYFIEAFAQVKKAAARTNKELGTIPANVADALISACDDLLAGKYHDQFVTDWLQGGAGTSTNMNTNEVICNIACEKLGLPKGSQKQVSPNDHANFGQSTNDTYPTALHLAMYLRSEDLLKALEQLRDSFYKKADEFKNVLKMGRTHLQDAVPMSMGQEFHGWGRTIEDEIETIKDAQKHLRVINLGGTAIGTTVTCHPDYPAKAVKYLSEQTGIDFHNSTDLIAATSDCGAYVAISSALKSLAVKLTKVCNDIRLLASGPRTGLSEINLPMRQPGSSIMPGKVNPVIPEVTNQACFLAIGLDTTVMLAASAGQLELNVMEPVISFAVFTSMKVLTNAMITLREKCVDGITANAEHTKDLVMNSLGIVTLLKPHFGYMLCAEMAKEGYLQHKSLHQIVVEERKLMSEEKWNEVFSFQNLIAPKFEM
ncbi:aspartate ammonia-lyase [Mesosutterella sp. OilRF-GAM-744-9]|uniref:Aspartate ammonia-lyase n=1 Tax=Mesosutterella porci TaxID=2915351 RepID=A0ABS9MMY3_9BURK|nr:aspartate ammonia-lyase [Mesosutterella sp. oilRF-744-WT-GAM-9]MCG5029984.1 aspartate ammonia-lyase [Mesosutterella sp. oilRF-744-WT-GAM-9]MCI6531024.1 aspartate ammonia-lyase [Mesosutterella sp.]